MNKTELIYSIRIASTEEELKKAYKNAVKVTHPDSSGYDSSKDFNEIKDLYKSKLLELDKPIITTMFDVVEGKQTIEKYQGKNFSSNNAKLLAKELRKIFKTSNNISGVICTSNDLNVLEIYISKLDIPIGFTGQTIYDTNDFYKLSSKVSDENKETFRVIYNTIVEHSSIIYNNKKDIVEFIEPQVKFMMFTKEGKLTKTLITDKKQNKDKDYLDLYMKDKISLKSIPNESVTILYYKKVKQKGDKELQIFLDKIKDKDWNFNLTLEYAKHIPDILWQDWFINKGIVEDIINALPFIMYNTNFKQHYPTITAFRSKIDNATFKLCKNIINNENLNDNMLLEIIKSDTDIFNIKKVQLLNHIKPYLKQIKRSCIIIAEILNIATSSKYNGVTNIISHRIKSLLKSSKDLNVEYILFLSLTNKNIDIEKVETLCKLVPLDNIVKVYNIFFDTDETAIPSTIIRDDIGITKLDLEKYLK